MDHIVSPKEPAQPAVKVPYLPDDRWAYDDLGFADFPARKNLDATAIRKGNFGGLSNLDVLSFIQSWMYFGLLREAFKIGGISLAIEDFITTDTSGEMHLSTDLLRHYVTVWAYRTRMLSSVDVTFKQRDALTQLLRVAGNFLVVIYWRDDSISEFFRRSNPFTDADEILMRDAILLSCDILAHSFTHMFMHFSIRMFHHEPDHIYMSGGQEGIQETVIPDLTEFMRRRLITAGWCPYTISKLERTGCPCQLYAMSQVRAGYQTVYKHGSCTSSQCVMNRKDENDYAPAHRGDCECHLIVMNDAIFANDTSGIPLITYANASTGGDHLKVSSFDITSEDLRRDQASWKQDDESGTESTTPVYVAISHVWSDGLGNPRQNGLPSCQLAFIQASVNALFPERCSDVPFWIDTLCIPLNNQRHRRQAIANMRNIFRFATKVLVIESSMSFIRAPETVWEFHCRVALSRWPLRLWTLQEGQLSRQLYFQFADRALLLKANLVSSHEPDHIKDDAEVHRRTKGSLAKIPRAEIVDRDVLAHYMANPPPRHLETLYFTLTQSEPVLNSLAGAVSGLARTCMDPLEQESRSGLPALTGLISAVANRSTTRPSDEALCYSSLLLRNSGTYSDVPEEERLKAFVKSFTRIPAALIFGAVPRFEEQGWRWCPKSFLQLPTKEWKNEFASGSITDQGLMVRYPGLLFPLGSMCMPANGPSTDRSNTETFDVHRNTELKFWLYSDRAFYRVESKVRRRDWTQAPFKTVLGIILSYSMPADKSVNGWDAALVSVHELRHGNAGHFLLTCQREGDVKVTGFSFERVLEIGPLEMPVSKVLLSASRFQQWCVG